MDSLLSEPAISANNYLKIKYGKTTFNNCNSSIMYMFTDEINPDFEHRINPSPTEELCSSTGINARLVSGTKTSPVLDVIDIEAGDTYHAMPVLPIPHA